MACHPPLGIQEGIVFIHITVEEVLRTACRRDDANDPVALKVPVSVDEAGVRNRYVERFLE